MAIYKCFKCGKNMSSKNLGKMFSCPHCGSRIFYKPRKQITNIKAR